MKTIKVLVSTLSNGDFFSVGVYDYLFVGKTKFQDVNGYVGCNQSNGDLKVFDFDQIVEIPRPKPVRTTFWYKKKFLELVGGGVEHDKVEFKFNTICSRLYAELKVTRYGILQELCGKYGRDDYIITLNGKPYDGVTIMLINTRTGKSVSCKHLDPEKITMDNIYVIFIDLYKKYMNQ
jgi:hypothetical protein